VIPKRWGAAGDLTFEVGTLLTAVIYLTWAAGRGPAGPRRE